MGTEAEIISPVAAGMCLFGITTTLGTLRFRRLLRVREMVVVIAQSLICDGFLPQAAHDISLTHISSISSKPAFFIKASTSSRRQ
jgi:hypothetical protein